MAHRWYVAATHPGAERSAERHLVRQRFEAYVPVFGRVRVERGRRVVDNLVTFVGYAFVAFDVETRSRWRAINGSRGVIKLLPTFAEMPEPLPVGCVEELLARFGRGPVTLEEALETARKYVFGEAVEVTSGPFAGQIGEFERRRGEVADLFLALLGRRTRVELKFDQLAPAERRAS